MYNPVCLFWPSPSSLYTTSRQDSHNSDRYFSQGWGSIPFDSWLNLWLSPFCSRWEHGGHGLWTCLLVIIVSILKSKYWFEELLVPVAVYQQQVWQWNHYGFCILAGIIPQEGVGDQLSVGCTLPMVQFQALAEKIYKRQRKAILYVLRIQQDFSDFQAITAGALILLSISLQQIRLRMDQATYVFLLNRLLSLLTKNIFDRLMKDGRVLKFLETTYGTF